MNFSSLDDLVTARQLRRETFTPEAVAALLQRAARLADDAARAELAPPSGFTLGVEAAFALASAALRLRGYRYEPSCNRRTVAFHALAYTLGAPTPLWATLAAAEERRAELDEGGAAPAAGEVTVLLARVRELESLVRALVQG